MKESWKEIKKRLRKKFKKEVDMKVKEYFLNPDSDISQEEHDQYMAEIYDSMNEESLKFKKEAERLREENKKLTKRLNELEAKDD